MEFDVNNVDAFENSLNQRIEHFAQKLGLENYQSRDSNADSLSLLFSLLENKNIKIVILIDEYDCQLTANINNVELYNRYQSAIRSLYAVIKGKRSIRFLGITGVTRLKDVSIFSVGSDIIDVTYQHNVSTLTGFTREEIKTYYIDYINLTASLDNETLEEQVTDEQREQVLDRLAYEYNGYCFDELNQNRVFSTWSVNKFFTWVKNNNLVVYGDYWYENGGIPSILRNYLETHELNLKSLLGEKIKIINDNFYNPTSLITMEPSVLMCQAGYLTLRSSLINSSMAVELDIPNNEVRRALSTLLCLKITNNNYLINCESLEKLTTGSCEDIIQFFNEYLKTINYAQYPINNESILRGYLHIILLCYRVNVDVEVHNSKGRSDIQMDFDDRRVILELKYAKDASEVKDKLQKAQEQIKIRDYGNTLPYKKELIRLAVVFDGEQKEFTAYKSV